jgi:KAP family P-loop domain
MSSTAFIDQIKRQIDAHLQASPATRLSVKEAFVVSLYGEWGIGKTHCLTELNRVYTQALAAALNSNSAQPLTLTVPVMFSPWRFEKEDHLIVPLVKTIQARLDDLGKDSRLTDTHSQNANPLLQRMKKFARDMGSLGISLAAGLKFKISLLGLVSGQWSVVSDFGRRSRFGLWQSA